MSFRHFVGSVIGIAGVALCLTLLSSAMRGTLDVGGFCASGGPYQIAVHCPNGNWLIPVSLLAGLVFLGVFAVFSPLTGSRVYYLGWSAMFLALGWNFIEYGLPWHGNGFQLGFLFPGILFVVMGIVPLLSIVPSLLRALTQGSNHGTSMTMRLSLVGLHMVAVGVGIIAGLYLYKTVAG